MGVYEILVIVAFAVDFSSSFFERIRIRIRLTDANTATANNKINFFHEDGNGKLLFTSFRIIKVFTFNYS